MLEGLFQPTHLLVLLGIALLVFGPRKIPELGKGLGEGIRGFKSAISGNGQPPTSVTSESVSDSTHSEMPQAARNPEVFLP
jgi:sec-independent protein translocase protein TatA